MSYLEWPNPKDPDAERTYTVTWEDLRPGENIFASAWDFPEGISGSGEAFNNTITSVKIAGGVSGKSYDAVNTITTNMGNIIPRTIKLKVKDR